MRAFSSFRYDEREVPYMPSTMFIEVVLLLSETEA